jgi:hypothetical protein
MLGTISFNTLSNTLNNNKPLMINNELITTEKLTNT